MEITEELIAKIVRAVVEALRAQGQLPAAGQLPATCRTCGSEGRQPAPAPAPAAGDGTVAVPAPAGKRRLVVTEELVRQYAKQGCRRLRVPANALVTPLGREAATDKRIEISRG